jgi:hypothetical protein
MWDVVADAKEGCVQFGSHRQVEKSRASAPRGNLHVQESVCASIVLNIFTGHTHETKSKIKVPLSPTVLKGRPRRHWWTGDRKL